jgi:heterodisulfide reductase subunit A-like polyferredoxin
MCVTAAHNIGKVVDIPSTVEYALTLPNVVHAEESLFICSTDAAKTWQHPSGKRD